MTHSQSLSAITACNRCRHVEKLSLPPVVVAVAYNACLHRNVCSKAYWNSGVMQRTHLSDAIHQPKLLFHYIIDMSHTVTGSWTQKTGS